MNQPAQKIDGWLVDENGAGCIGDMDRAIHIDGDSLVVETLGATSDDNVQATARIPLTVVRAVLGWPNTHDLSPGCNRHWEERNTELVRERDEALAFLRRTAMTGGSIVSSAAMTAQQIAIAQAADRMLVTADGYGFVYVPGPRFCACGRIESDCDQSRASCSKADPASEDEESDIIIAGRQVPFVQVGMIVHPEDCLNCERDGNPLWCSALVCDIHDDDDETARFGMMATLLFRNGERREEPCDELRRRWRMARDFDQNRVYTGRWGAIPRGSVWPVAEVNEDA